MKKCGILLNGIFFSLKEASTWLKLEDIMLSEISPDMESQYCVIKSEKVELIEVKTTRSGKVGEIKRC